MCLWIALWFASGIIMMYVEYPELTEVERLAMQEAIATDAIMLDVAEAVLRAGPETEFDSIRLSQVLGRPAYQFTGSSGARTTVFADTGELLRDLQQEQAIFVAEHSGFAAAGSKATHAGLLDMDQWTVTSVLDPERPLHKVQINDAAGTVVYVSAGSGQVVRDTARTERFWNWLGSTIHWIYPWQLRRNVSLWTNILIYLSLAGVVTVVSGGIIGFMRLRVKQPWRGSSVTPYRGFNKWHHLIGLCSLVFVSTFMFSGLMSMYPWGIFDNATSVEEQTARYTEAGLPQFAAFPTLGQVAEPGELKEVEWKQLGGEPYLVLVRSADSKEVIFAGGESGADALQSRIEAALPALQPAATLLESTVVQSYDNYYYSHHNRYRPLPALRVVFNDAEQSWYYIDLNTGTVVQRLTSTDRVARWLYNGLHSLDFALLFQHRPLWDLVVILLCLCGFAFALTCVVLGWRRLVR